MVLDTFQIMPNHLHGIFVIPGPGLEPSLAAATRVPLVQPQPNVGARSLMLSGPAAPCNKGTASRTPTSPAMGDVVGGFKSVSTIELNRFLSRVGRRLLQENFYEHIIRDVASLQKIRDYIAQNPARWLEDPENPDRSPGNWPDSEWDWL